MAARKGKLNVLDIKLASIVVHVQELLSADGREADRLALVPLVTDQDIRDWLLTFDSALLPVKRREKGD